jgi:presenilin 1
MTFVVVLLYKYRCMKILFGYMIVATTALLGYFSAQMWSIAIDIYNLRVDKISFYFILYNFAAVGTVAIFYGKGFPRFVSQGYLIASSVILAWQLSYFNEWTAWTLLVMLALYDLFAVLSPCGPLKALVHQMQRPDAPEMPGLLYEANLPTDVRRPNRPRPQQQATPANTEESPASRPREVPATTERVPNDENMGSSMPPLPNVSIQSVSSQPPHDPETVASPISMTRSTTGEIEMAVPRRSNERATSRESAELALPPPESAESTSPAEIPESDVESLTTGKVALAVAKVYKLQVIDDEGVLRQRGQRREEAQRVYAPEDVRARQWTPKQLKTDVKVVFPRRGGRIERAEPRRRGEGPQYIVYNRDRQVLRTFVVNDKGELFQVVQRSREDDPKDNTIKLGLVSSARMDTV